ncbi:LacI family DNA-binding transcriptional regulator [Spongiimicrobium salis]|uniref:LacI family DNA-binding transcriptional regulator n=1 Tax=Spongiimicrobium salis TaxID=1667022 RepID=UPI00374CC642
MKMTLKKIARELDVSISTVSKALNDDRSISIETRNRIKAFAKFYNYTPNSIAQSLKSRSTKTIGVIIPEIIHDFFAKVIDGIEKAALDRGYSVIIGMSNESYEKEVMSIEMLVKGKIDGILLSVSKGTLLKKDYEHLKNIQNMDLPLILFDRVIEDISCDKVIIDDFEGAKNGVNQLIASGCKKILLLTTQDYLEVGKLRTQGYIEAHKENNLPVHEALILKNKDIMYNEIESSKLTKKIHAIFDAHPDIDGIFAVNEVYALNATKIAMERGLKIPEEISVVSFSGGILSRYSRPAMSSVMQDGKTMGEFAANLLIDKLEKKEEKDYYVTKVIPTTFTKRDSTK